MQVGSANQVETKVTFPEGFTMHQIFQRLDENNICSYVDLMNAAANYDFTYPFLEDIPLGDRLPAGGLPVPGHLLFSTRGQSATSTIDRLLGTFPPQAHPGDAGPGRTDGLQLPGGHHRGLP